jgi:hypothetical protein
MHESVILCTVKERKLALLTCQLLLSQDAVHPDQMDGLVDPCHVLCSPTTFPSIHSTANIFDVQEGTAHVFVVVAYHQYI